MADYAVRRIDDMEAIVRRLVQEGARGARGHLLRHPGDRLPAERGRLSRARPLPGRAGGGLRRRCAGTARSTSRASGLRCEPRDDGARLGRHEAQALPGRSVGMRVLVVGGVPGRGLLGEGLHGARRAGSARSELGADPANTRARQARRGAARGGAPRPVARRRPLGAQRLELLPEPSARWASSCQGAPAGGRGSPRGRRSRGARRRARRAASVGSGGRREARPAPPRAAAICRRSSRRSAASSAGAPAATKVPRPCSLRTRPSDSRRA